MTLAMHAFLHDKFIQLKGSQQERIQIAESITLY